VKRLPFGSVYRVSADTGAEFSHPDVGGRRILHRCADTEDRHLSCSFFPLCRLRLKCDGTRAETRFRLSAKRTSPFNL
jgi:hypothetical protein